MILFRYTWGELVRRPGRTLLTLMGTVLGVAAIVAIGITVATTRDAYRGMVDAMAGRAALEVVAPGYEGVDPTLADRVRAVPGVRSVATAVQGPVARVGGTSPELLLVVGIPADEASALREETLVEGRVPATGDEAMLVDSYARPRALGVGMTLRLLTRAGLVSLEVVGLVEPGGTALFNGGAVVRVPLETAQRLFGLGSKVTSIQVVPGDGEDVEALRARIQSALPAGALVESPAMRGTLSRESLGSTELGFAAMSAMALVAGAFIVLNTFRMNVTERRKQVAILRAVGATGGQVLRILLREALLFGLLGTALGIGLGVALSYGFSMGIDRLLGIGVGGPRVAEGPFLAAAILGPASTILAAALPAMRAAREPVLDALQEAKGGTRETLRRRPAIWGLVLVAVGVLLAVGFVTRTLPLGTVAPSMALTLTGLVLALPLVLPVLLRALEPLLARGRGTGRMAFRVIDRRRVRTALTVGVLFLAVAVALGMGNSILGNLDDISDWYARTITADFYVRASMPDSGTATAAQVPEPLGDEIRALHGVDSVARLRFLPARARDQAVLVLAIDFDPSRVPDLDLHRGAPEAARVGLARGEIVLGTVLAQRFDLGPGDELVLDTPTGARPLRIAATATEYTVGGAALFMDYSKAHELLGLTGVDVFLVRVPPEVRAPVAAALKDLCVRNGCLLQANADLRAVVDEMIGGVTGLLWSLLALVFVVAALGVVNTMTMSVLEQTREIGVLRSVGLTRGQTRRLVLLEALSLGLLSLPPGVLGGAGLAVLLHVAAGPLTGQPIALSLHGGLVLAAAGMALGTALLSALPAALRASRLAVVDSLQYE